MTSYQSGGRFIFEFVAPLKSPFIYTCDPSGSDVTDNTPVEDICPSFTLNRHPRANEITTAVLKRSKTGIRIAVTIRFGIRYNLLYTCNGKHEILTMFQKRIGIDLGTANSLVYLAGVGVVLNEPTVVAVALDTNQVVAVGEEARQMLGRTPGNIVASRPMKDGVIADYQITEAMLAYFIQKVVGKSRVFKPEVMVCVPSGCTQVERRAVVDATLAAGARSVYLIDEPLAAAIGAQIPIANPSGNLIVDSGGGSTEAAVISLGGVVSHSSVRMSGNRLDEAIATYIRKKFNLIIGERTAEDVKITVGNALLSEKEQKDPKKMEVRGRDAISGLPRIIEISEIEMNLAITPILIQMIGSIKGVLEKTPPELAADIIDKGIVLSGGSALLKNLEKLVTKEIEVATVVAEEPMLCVVRGTGVALENLELYKKSIRSGLG
jgi:rod shape-determining protein MreB